VVVESVEQFEMKITIGSSTLFSKLYPDTDGAEIIEVSFEIGPLRIVNVELPPTPAAVDTGELELSSSPDEAIFTTKDGENTITVHCDAPSYVADESILYEIKEVNEDFEIDTAAIGGRIASFTASHKSLTTLRPEQKKSLPLVYEIIAYYSR